MSCFPRDDVHPSMRYEPAEYHSHQLKNICSTDRLEDILHANGLLLCIMPKFTAPDPFVVEPQELGGKNISSASNADQPMCGVETSVFPHTQDQYLNGYSIDNSDVSDTVSPIPASTALDGISNWSSSESAPDFGMMPPNTCEPFLLQQSNQTTACRDFLGDGVHFLCENLQEVGWHELVTCCDSAISLQPVPFLENSQSERDLSAAHPTDYSDGGSTNISSTFDGPTDPATYSSSASTLPSWQSESSDAEDSNAIDHDFNPIDKEVDDFLDELGNTIDWDQIQHNLDDTASTQIDNDTNTQLEDDASMSSSSDGSQEEVILQDPTCSDDDWLDQFIGEVQGFATFDQLLEEHKREAAAAAAVSEQ